MNFTDLAIGKRVIVGGASLQLPHLPPELLNTGVVIGINSWPKTRPCDYWIALDTGKLFRQEEAFIRSITCPRIMRRPNPTTESYVPDDLAHWYDKAKDTVPTTWQNQLKFVSSTALAAINFAIVLGASEVVLYGVDFVGDGRADGSKYGKADFWGIHKDGINKLLREFREYVPVYKLHPESWLDCPLFDL